ncbi:thioesterase family protein [Pararhodobacter sp.]|uniref:acyl-CoA thioesterase n=1 Tax=Pararhodobacter sp. TaxID=2127056 RepID=UPI002AFE0147|nr:thioesterase family protein [Pararhodobacter sp.]
MPEVCAATDGQLRFRTQETLRFGDQDVQGHINNAVYSTLLECNRVAFQTTGKCLVLEPTQNVVVAAIAIDFLRELHWPATVEIRLGVTRIGRSSFDFAQEIWLGETRVSRARSTQVLMVRATRKPTPLSEDQRQQLSDWFTS